MAANSWALACMLTLGQAPLGQAQNGQAPNDVLITNQRSLSVPVDIQESRRAELRELVLYASSDLGRNWQQVAVMPPTQPAFTFTAPIDGNYWLRVAVINRLGKQEPENPFQGPPDQKVVIDTMKPLLRMRTPERTGDNVALAWELQEEHPDWSSFRLEYQPKDGNGAWTPIQATAGLTGEARFRANTPSPITIRLSLKDQAGNQAIAPADAGGGPISATAFSTGQTTTQAPAPAAPAPAALPAPMFPGVPTQPMPPAPGQVQSTIVPPPHVDTPRPQAPSQPIKTFPMNPTMNPAPAVSAPWTAPNTNSADAANVVASTRMAPPPAAATPVQAVENRRPLPPLQYVNHPEVTLEYELARVGPSGIGNIELWWTQNDGQTWELYAVDPEGRSGTIREGRHKRTVELPGEGVYGFILVVKSKAGLGKAPPRAGDLPEIRMHVDTTAPVADLFKPQPDPHKTNTLLLKWQARDDNLTNTPIVLEWSEKRDGPWHAIAPPLPNAAGKHSWTLPDRLPVEVYLRLRVRDLAGNESVAVTAEPQLVDLSEPEGRLLNVTVSPR